ncbi:hypothetical protein CGMCC3_g3981 [Colletotrichum fructicola]|nr:uncharacterized protein CGMCC3_g3981 [Colletotrichum fructicola]KAE9580221.1 hypothetical protein CGMCC3_g3981 [Colletotrichum fructicola]
MLLLLLPYGVGALNTHTQRSHAVAVPIRVSRQLLRTLFIQSPLGPGPLSILTPPNCTLLSARYQPFQHPHPPISSLPLNTALRRPTKTRFRFLPNDKHPILFFEITSRETGHDRFDFDFDSGAR